MAENVITKKIRIEDTDKFGVYHATAEEKPIGCLMPLLRESEEAKQQEKERTQKPRGNKASEDAKDRQSVGHQTASQMFGCLGGYMDNV